MRVRYRSNRINQTPTLAPGGPTKTVTTPPATLPPMTQPPYYITCSMDPTSGKYQASVAPIVIPSTQTINQWKQSGQSAGWSVQFPSGQTPCSNGYTFQNTASCLLASGVTLNTPYNYTATLNRFPTGDHPPQQLAYSQLLHLLHPLHISSCSTLLVRSEL